MRKPDVIPTTIKGFNPWVNTFVPAIIADADFLNLGDEETAKLTADLGIYNPFYTICMGNNVGKEDRSKLETGTKALKKTVRSLIAYHVTGNPKVTNDKRISYGLGPLDNTRTRQTQIIESPVMKNLTNASGLLKMSGKLANTKRSGLPLFAESMELCWDFVENGVAPEAKECRHGEPCYGSKGTINVGAEQRRQEIAVYGRYLNHFPNPGPWSAKPIRVVIL